METYSQQEHPIISVIVPVYKVEKYLEACINSILSQTYRDFELILVDDGSPDNCGACCDFYAAREPRIRVIHQKNIGLAGARNSGMDVAKGEYITFIDSDDLIMPQYLEQLYRAIDCSGASFSVCMPREFLDGDEEQLMKENCQFGYRTVLGVEACEAMYTGDPHFPVNACGKLFSARLICRHSFPVGRIHEDQAVVPLAYSEAFCVASLKSPLYLYRVRDDSITRERFNVKRYDDIWAVDQCIAYYKVINAPKIIKAARQKRKRLLAVYSIYARRDGVEVPKEYRVGLLSALIYLRKNVQPRKYQYYLAQVSPKLARLFEYEIKLKQMLGR